MPCLKEVQICGTEYCAIPWGVPTSSANFPDSPDFMIEGPSILKVNLGVQSSFLFPDGEALDHESSSTLYRLSSAHLVALFRSSPLLESLDLSLWEGDEGILIADVAFAMEEAPPMHLKRLVLQHHCDDAFIAQLPRLAPLLAYLDVRGGKYSVTLPALTRLADRFVRLRAAQAEEEHCGIKLQLSGQGGLRVAKPPHLTIEYDEVSEGESTHVLKVAFRELALRLSPNQIAHLHPKFNGAPGAPSYLAVKQEILHVVDPSIHLQKLGKAGVAAQKAILPAPADVYASAIAAMNAWLARRELDRANVYCERSQEVMFMDSAYSHTGFPDEADAGEEVRELSF